MWAICRCWQLPTGMHWAAWFSPMSVPWPWAPSSRDEATWNSSSGATMTQVIWRPAELTSQTKMNRAYFAWQQKSIKASIFFILFQFTTAYYSVRTKNIHSHFYSTRLPFISTVKLITVIDQCYNIDYWPKPNIPSRLPIPIAHFGNHRYRPISRIFGQSLNAQNFQVLVL